MSGPERIETQLVATDNSRPEVRRLPYRAPQLRFFGSIVGLTGAATIAGPADMTLPSMMSSIEVKESVVQIGEHPAGFGLYLFDYKPEFQDTWGHGRQFGVIAEEVERVLPAAVSMHPDGYRQVDYSMLGIRKTPR